MPKLNKESILASLTEIEELTKLLQGRPTLATNIRIQVGKIRGLIHESEVGGSKKRNA